VTTTTGFFLGMRAVSPVQPRGRAEHLRIVNGAGTTTERAEAGRRSCLSEPRATRKPTNVTATGRRSEGLDAMTLPFLAQRFDDASDTGARRSTRRAPWLALALAAAVVASPAAAQEAIGPVTKLPLPRYASLKSDRVNLREGPSKEHATKFVFQRAGLPVEIVAEFETWRRIRDSEGTEGWVLHSLLSGRRTALIAPWKKGEMFVLRQEPKETGATVAKVQANVIANVKSCDGKWCRLFGDGFDGYLEQAKLWGAYPGESVK
jgi:SH3-like domain-containing protein